MNVRGHQIFSNWIFIASLLSPVTDISLYPLLLLTIPFGLPFYKGELNRETMYKNIYGFIIHFIPFLWTKAILNPSTIYWNICLLTIYMITMYILNLDIVKTYRIIYTEQHPTLAHFLDERFGIKL